MTWVQICGLRDRGELWSSSSEPGLSDLAICWPWGVGLPGQGQVCVPELDLSRCWWGWGRLGLHGEALSGRGREAGIPARGRDRAEILAWVGGVSWAGWGVGTE